MRARFSLVVALMTGGSAPAGEIAFTTTPRAERSADKVKITFELSAPTDVEVGILDGRNAVVRHLAAGLLGDNPPEPLEAGLSQTLQWNGRDDFGRPATGGPFSVRVRAGSRFAFGLEMAILAQRTAAPGSDFPAKRRRHPDCGYSATYHRLQPGYGTPDRLA